MVKNNSSQSLAVVQDKRAEQKKHILIIKFNKFIKKIRPQIPDIDQCNFDISLDKKRRNAACKRIPENNKLTVLFAILVFYGKERNRARKKYFIGVLTCRLVHIINPANRALLMICHLTAVKNAVCEVIYRLRGQRKRRLSKIGRASCRERV